jgi:hypothetical protein
MSNRKIQVCCKELRQDKWNLEDYMVTPEGLEKD